MMRPFGQLPDGRTVHAIALGQPTGLQTEILTYGGIARHLTVPVRGTRENLVITLPDLGAYVADTAYVGGLIGRVSNRIAESSFELDGTFYMVTPNEGRNHLHGGKLGFGKVLWRVLDYQPANSRLTLGYHSPTYEEGYPGNLDVTASFTLEERALDLRIQAQCDQPTPVSLTYHPYLNLSDNTHHAHEQILRLPASNYLPLFDARLLPSGRIASVAGTPFDFRSAHAIRTDIARENAQLQIAGGYDHCWILDPNADYAAELFSPHSGLRLRIKSNQTAIQFYSGHGLSRAHPNAGSGICLEPQAYPDAINEHTFPSPVLRPGAVYECLIRYELSS